MPRVVCDAMPGEMKMILRISECLAVIQAQLPALPAGALETWLLAGMGAGTLVLLAKKLFVRKPPLEAEFLSKADFAPFRASVERELERVRDRLDARFLGLTEKMDELKSELLHAANHGSSDVRQRLSSLEAALARLDERTRR
jgi:hypothetical protein